VSGAWLVRPPLKVVSAGIARDGSLRAKVRNSRRAFLLGAMGSRGNRDGKLRGFSAADSREQGQSAGPVWKKAAANRLTMGVRDGEKTRETA